MEKHTLSSRGKIRIFLYITTIIFVLGIFSITQTVKANRLERQLDAHNQLSLISLDENINNISTNLEKLMYSNSSPMLSKLASELWRETSGAKTNLSLLPTSDISLSNTYKFLSQVGELVMSLSRKSASGEKLNDDERQQLLKLYEYSKALNEQISNMCFDLENGIFSFEDYDSSLLGENSYISINGSFDDVEQSLSDLPSLIYDGPFSDHIEQGEAKYLKDLETVNKKKAFEIAKNVCNTNETASLEYAYDEDGNIPSYVFKSKNCTVAITKNGGKPLYMLNSKFVGEIEISYDEAVRNAREFLKKIGFENMSETYYFAEDGICTVNFSFKENGVVVYPDLIKVSVSLESGDVLAFDATGYIYNHYDRQFSNPKISKEKAMGFVNTSLEIIDTQLSIIPTDWETEEYCYEVHCKATTGQELLVYIDCTTGEEKDILILLYSDGGVLTK